jgi:RHS repeat-associated protein
MDQTLAAGSILNNALTKLSLPDGTAYTFSYDPVYGTVSQINFPEGGYVRFDYDIRSDGTGNSFFPDISTVYVKDVYISDGVFSEQQWMYEAAPYVPGSGLNTTVTAPDGSSVEYKGESVYPSQYFALEGSPTWLVTSALTRDATGTLKKSVSTDYTSLLPSRIVTTYYDGPNPLQQEILYTYDAYGNVVEKDESNFNSCSGSPCPVPSTSPAWLRSTYTTYWHSTHPNYITAYIVDKPSQVLITDGANNPVSLTTYAYDETGHMGTIPTGVTTHDDINYGASSTLPRGNLTTENKCFSIAGTGTNVTCASAWSTSYSYDLTGQMTQKIEGYGTAVAAATTYTWAGPNGATDSYNGYLTKATHPNGATDQYLYYSTTGQVESHTDWNNKVTSYTYDRYLNRLASITDPQTTDGTTGALGNGSASYTYTDTKGTFSVQEQHLITGSTKSSTTRTFDGLGRLITAVAQVPSSQCSSGTVTVATSYDSMSRVYSVTNPYCAASDTYGTTTYEYDALGRKTQTTLPDGAVDTISYAGNAMETTDPPNGMTSVQHIQQVDGLGRLTDICEVSSLALGSDLNPSSCGLKIVGTGYLTHYKYDTMSNLQSVSQHGQSRSFSYDALSRLTQATNPETGSTPNLYTYSTPSTPCTADTSLPCTKTDTRGVMTTYKYDNVNRPISKSYSTVAGNTTGVISDLTSCYQYDKALSGVTDSNPKGQLTVEWQQSGACPASPVTAIPSGAVTARIRSNHDAMGRVGDDQQCLLGANCSATVGNFVYSYNLAGSLVQSNNGIQAGAVSASQIGTNSTSMTAPSVTWMTTYDIAGHVQQANVQDHPSSSVWPANVFSTDPTLLRPTSFDPFSHVTAAQVGVPYGSSTAGISISRQYDVRSRLITELDYGAGSTSSATHGLGTITIAGSEQGPTYPASSYATASASIGGSEQSYTFNPCAPHSDCTRTVYDSGSITLTINGTSVSTSYGQGVSTSIMAASLAQQVNSAGIPAIATASGSTISLRATIPETAGNSITISGTSATGVTQFFNSPSYSIGTSAFANGVNALKNVYDQGTVTATVAGVSATVNFGINTASNPQAVAAALASAIQNASGSKVTAKSDGDVSVLVSSATGSSTDYTVSTSVAYDSVDFTQPSFMALAFAMQDGLAADSTDGLIYYYFVPNGGYAPNGNILAHSDKITGDWIYGYDAADRLTSEIAAGNNPSNYLGKIGCWTYDTYGNRTLEAFSSVACGNNPTPQVSTTYNTTNNRIVNSTFSPNTVSGVGTFQYDASGNTIYDGKTRYWYDAEGQLCAVLTGSGAMIQYVYDAEGARIAQGTLQSVPSSYTATCAPPAPNSIGSGLTSGMGLSLTKRYLVDLSGAQVTEFSEGGSENWQHSNVWSAGKLVATYDTKGLHFELTDPLGTKRVQANIAGQVDETCTSLPFGNDVNNPLSVNCSVPANGLQTNDDATEHHFTSRERDSETGNDYLLARYYSSALGRFISPDWSAKEEPVPYAKLDDPQTLNLYAYVENNPLSRVDPDGHEIKRKHHHRKKPPVVQQTQEQKTEVAYGETSGILPARDPKAPAPPSGKKENPYDPATWDKASAEQLQKARENIIDVSDVNKNVHKGKAGSNQFEQEQWQQSGEAAKNSDGSSPGKYFFIRQDGIGNQRPPASAGYGQGDTIKSYGPFRNVGGGDVPRGPKTYIDIYDK